MALSIEELGITQEELQQRVVDAIVTSVCDDVEEDVASRFFRELKLEVQKQVTARVSIALDASLGAAINDVLTGVYQPVNEWGEPKGKPTCLREMVQAKAARFITETVDKEFKPSNYDAMPRIDRMVKDHVEKAVGFEIKRELEKAVDAEKARLQLKVAQVIVDRILKN